MKFERAVLVFLLVVAFLYALQWLGFLPGTGPGGAGRPTAVPQPIIIQMVPAGATAVPAGSLDVAPTPIPAEGWIMVAPATAVPVVAAPTATATITAVPGQPRLVQGCSLSRGTCPGQGSGQP
jgi:hypothetical protein